MRERLYLVVVEGVSVGDGSDGQSGQCELSGEIHASDYTSPPSGKLFSELEEVHMRCFIF